MQDNYRHQHYLLASSSANSQPQATAASSKSLARQADSNGLPAPSRASGYSRFVMKPQSYQPEQPIDSYKFNSSPRLASGQPAQLAGQQQLGRSSQRVALGQEYFTSAFKQQRIEKSNENGSQMQFQPKQRQFQREAERDDDDEGEGERSESSSQSNGRHQSQEHYANQLRNSQIQQQLRQAYQASKAEQQHEAQARVQHEAQRAGPSRLEQQQQQQEVETSKGALHVNFNRANRIGGGPDEEEQDSRKKKYLTAKYGQQQMNLIKKRLKIEMWLHEQLQELAKGSRFEAELDEIDIELDELLDMDDDEKRRHWLKRLLAPFEDLPGAKVDKFIGQVLDQSKLL